MAERRSFFERLTGSTRRDADEDETEVLIDARPDEEGDAAPEAPERDAREEERRPEAVPEAPAEGEEGQLTVDVYQTPEHIVVQSTIAGVKPDDLDVSITNDMVTIRGTRRRNTEVQDGDYFYRECYWGQFSRSIILPVDIVAEKAEASLKDGILTIHIPKADALLTKKVKVRGF